MGEGVGGLVKTAEAMVALFEEEEDESDDKAREPRDIGSGLTSH